MHSVTCNDLPVFTAWRRHCLLACGYHNCGMPLTLNYRSYRATSVGQNVIIQAIHVNYTSWYGKLSENYAESKK